MNSDILPALTTGLSIIEAVAITGVLSPLMAREPDTRPDNDNHLVDLTELTVMGFACALLIGIVVTPIVLWGPWS